MRNIAFRWILMVLCLVFSGFNTLNFHKAKIRTVVIDAGHGGKDPGCSGRTYKEKNVALAVALEVGKLIKTNYPTIKVVYTRRDDTFIELEERTNIANRSQADVFISIHCNSSPNKKICGTETYVMGMHKTEDNLDVAMRENSSITQETNYKKRYNFDPNSVVSYIKLSNFQSAYNTQSIDFATRITKDICNSTNFVNRGVKQSGFLVLWRTAMPSVLIEIGFLSNTQEEKKLGSVWGQKSVAKGIFSAFKSYKWKIESAQ